MPNDSLETKPMTPMMEGKYARLAEILEEMGEPRLAIQSVHILKAGCSHSYPIEDSQGGDSPNKETGGIVANQQKDSHAQPLKLYNELLDYLGKHRNVFNIEEQTDRPDPPFTYSNPDSEWFLLDGKGFHLEVNLPARLQKYSGKEIFEQSRPLERFEVLSKGSLFVAFAPISDYPFFTYIGHEYREIVLSVLKKNSPDEFRTPGPTPIHPDFYLIQAETDDEGETSGVRVYSRDDNVFVVFPNHHLPPRDWIMAFFEYIHYPLLMFYSALLTREQVLNSYVEIFERFSVLSDSIKNLTNTRWWKFVECSGLVRKGKDNLSEVHLKTIEFETALFGLRLQRNKATEQIESHTILSEIPDYFKECMQPDALVPESFPNALVHFEGEIRAYKQIRSVVVASFLGAAIGAFLTVLLSQLI